VHHPGLSPERQTVHVRAADQHCLRAEGERLDDVGAAADAAVEQHGQARADGLGNGRQRVEGGDRAIELPAAVVRHDYAIHPGFGRGNRVRCGLDAFKHDRAVPALPQERQVIPGDRGVAEHLGPVQDPRLRVALPVA
jgi:hypothetical protein